MAMDGELIIDIPFNTSIIGKRIENDSTLDITQLKHHDLIRRYFCVYF